MTDNDIIKALEMCTSCGCIESCPMFFNGTDSTSNCRYALLGKALTLINRQKAEIEDLIEEKEDLNEALKNLLGQMADWRFDAIEEFAERLKVKKFTKYFCGSKYDLIHGWIDDLVKEMVGERE